MIMSFGGLTVIVPLQPSIGVGAQPLYKLPPKFVFPVVREAPQIVPFRSPDLFPTPAGASKVSQKAGLVSPQFVRVGLGLGLGILVLVTVTSWCLVRVVPLPEPVVVKVAVYEYCGGEKTFKKSG